MEQPIGYELRDHQKWVWKLNKTLYSLKQGAKKWYDALYKALCELGFKQMEVDHGVFIKQVGKDLVVLTVHVDDCMVTGSSSFQINQFKIEMNKKYKLTDLGPENWLLGIKITRDITNKSISLSQHSYIGAIVTHFNFDDLKPSAIPIDPSVPLLKSQSPSKLKDIARMKKVPY